MRARKLMRGALGLLVGVAAAEYLPCDLSTCTCAGVSLAKFEKRGPYKLRDASKPTTTVLPATAHARAQAGRGSLPPATGGWAQADRQTDG